MKDLTEQIIKPRVEDYDGQPYSYISALQRYASSLEATLESLQGINWQPFDPNNPPKTKQVEGEPMGYEESEWMLLSFYDLFEIEEPCIGIITNQSGEYGWYQKDSLDSHGTIDVIKAYAIIQPSKP